MMTNLIFWQNVISPHQLPYIKEIPLLDKEYQVTLVVDQIIDIRRMEMGWNDVLFLPHGIENHFFNNAKRKKKKPLKIITVSRLLKRKNINLVIEALSKITNNYIYDVYGSGPEEEPLRKLIKVNNLSSKIKLKGHINNNALASILCEYDIFILVSHSETLGRVYFEAMASGLLVICSKGTGIDGIITHGKEGFVINLNNPSELVEIIESVLHDPMKIQRMGEKAFKKAKEFEWDKIIKLYSELYSGN